MPVLFIGLDACDKDLVQEWAAAGVLPVLRGLVARGLCGETLNPPGLYVGAVWPSLTTGVSPARHGIYADVQLRSGTYDFYRVNTADLLKRERFWHGLSRAGRRVAAIDFPFDVPTALNGIQVVRWGSHEPFIGFQTYPRELASDVLRQVGRHPVAPSCDDYRDRPAVDELRDDLLRGVERKTELVIDLLGRERWDFFGVVFSESHCVGHQCWHVHDRRHPRHDPAVAQRIGDPVRDVYIALDRAVGRLLEAAGPETTVVVLCSHGIGPLYGGVHLLEEIIYHWDVGRRRLKLRRLVQPIRRPLGRLKRYFFDPSAAEESVDGTAEQPVLRNPHFARRRCFAIPNNTGSGAVRVNLIGREPHGRVRPGAEYAALLKALRRDLLVLVDPRSGARLVRDVYCVADRYSGEHLENLPDLIVEWHRERPIEAAYSPKTGVVCYPFRDHRTGDHRLGGFVMMIGPAVRSGHLPAPIDSVDLAPTIAAWLGVALEDVDGRPFPTS